MILASSRRVQIKAMDKRIIINGRFSSGSAIGSGVSCDEMSGVLGVGVGVALGDSEGRGEAEVEAWGSIDTEGEVAGSARPTEGRNASRAQKLQMTKRSEIKTFFISNFICSPPFLEEKERIMPKAAMQPLFQVQSSQKR